MDDHQLLEEFRSSRSQESFRRLMERHLPMVYSTACRLVLDGSLAQDVAQNVFHTLLQKADSIRPPQVVGGWLYNTTRHIAMHTIRSERRRREREQAAADLQSLHAGAPDPIVADLEPAMAELDTADRDTLVLRFFENRSLREVGSELGISEDAARMRVNRAVERLREIFGRRSVTVSSAGLLASLGVATTDAVPAGLSSAVTNAVFGAAATKTLAITTMSWIHLKSIAAIATAMALTGAGTYVLQNQKVAQLRRDQQNLAAENSDLQTQLRSAQESARANQEQLQNVNKDADELLRLRNEVGQLQRQIATATVKSPAQSPASPTAPTASHRAANYQFTRDRFSHVGFGSPEDALVTAAWAVVQGGQDAIAETLSDELLADKSALAHYNRNQQGMGPILQQIKMVSKKTVSDTEVQIKVEYDLDMGNGAVTKELAITPMMKGKSGWKLGITRDYSDNWEQDGTIEPLGGN
jgi:RNA polymerase sigma factor (sigma-70 family)